MRRLAVALALALAACGGGSSTPDARVDPPIDASIDAPPVEDTLTTFVIGLVQDQTANDTDPVAYSAFSTLPDPDQDNSAAYDPLFP